MSDRRTEPVGVLLAGGLGRRLGGDKALAMLGGRPLIAHPLAAMRGALTDVVIVAKSDTVLPGAAELQRTVVWVEPDRPRHPLVGIVHALRAAAGRPVVACAADLPFVTAEALRALATADAGDAPAVLATTAQGSIQPLLGRYEPAAAALLGPAARAGVAAMRDVVAALHARLLAIEDPWVLFNVNSPEDLREAEDRLRRRARDH